MNFKERAIKEMRYTISEKFQDIRDIQSQINSIETEIKELEGI